MKKNIVIGLLAIALIANTLITWTTRAASSDLSEFTESQQKQLEAWWSDKWVEFFGSNVTVEPFPETGVKRDGNGDIRVKSITITDGDNETVITPTSRTCFSNHAQVPCP